MAWVCNSLEWEWEAWECLVWECQEVWRLPIPQASSKTNKMRTSLDQEHLQAVIKTEASMSSATNGVPSKSKKKPLNKNSRIFSVLLIQKSRTETTKAILDISTTLMNKINNLPSKTSSLFNSINLSFKASLYKETRLHSHRNSQLKILRKKCLLRTFPSLNRTSIRNNSQISLILERLLKLRPK